MRSGKRVIIVGPSVRIQQCKLGQFIDDFDIVVRLNKSLPVPDYMHEHIGSRTDVLYNSCNTTDYPGENRLDPIFFQKNGIKYIRCPYPPIVPFRKDIKAFQNRNRNSIPFGYIDPDYYRRLRYSLGTRPYTGTCAIADLLRHDIKQLFIMGVDFYTYAYAQYYRLISEKNLAWKRNSHVHKREPQIDLVRRFYLLDDRMIVDNILDKILLEKYDSLFYSVRSQVMFTRTCISALEQFIPKQHPLSMIRAQAKQTKGEKKLSMCLIGSLRHDKLKTDELKKYDFLVDLFPERLPPLPMAADLAVLNHMDELEPESYQPQQGILITDPFRKTYIIDEDNPRYKDFPRENILFLNPIFSKYLYVTLSQSVVPQGTLTPEVFLALYFAVYFGEEMDVYVKNMAPHAEWTQYEAKKRTHSVSQRLLYRYLVKRKWIHEL
jgi:hypothetical protein